VNLAVTPLPSSSAPLELLLRARDGWKPNKYAIQLLEHGRTLRVEFKENLTTETLIAEFLSKHKTPEG